MKKILLFFVSFFLIQAVDAQTNTLNEGFENWSNEGINPPPGWQIFTLGSNGLRGWRNGFNIAAHTGNGSAYSNIDNAGTNNWLVSPPITVLNDTYELKFWEIKAIITDFELDSNTVLISTGSSDPTSSDFTPIYQSNSLNDIDWEQSTIDLSTYSGQTIYIAFQHKNTAGKYLGWYLDDLTVGPTSFVDGALTGYISPVGVSENPINAPVSVRMKNLGTTTINDFNVTWDINTVAQPTFNQTALNLLPGQSTIIDIGTYNFSSEGAYHITTNLILANDFESSNNQIESTYEISSFKDGTIVAITPEGMLPNQGNIDVNVDVKNLGPNTIDNAEIIWSVDGVNQTPFTTTTLNLAPGATKTITVGQYTFSEGLHDISATLNALGDNNTTNNHYLAKAAFNTFWESFEGAKFPPDGWSIKFGIKDGRNFGDPVDGDYYYVSSVDNNFFGVISDTIFTPMLSIKNGDHFRFYIKTSPAQPANNKLVWKNGTTGEINLIQTIANSPGMNTWALRDINISAAAGNNYIGIISTSTGRYGETRYDLFTSDAKLSQFQNDLEIINGDMYFLAKQNTSETFECQIRNRGILPVSGANYTVKLMEAPNTELASVNGVNLNSWEETTISINNTFTDIGTKRLFFKIEYAADEFLANNTFRENDVNVVPNTVEISAIGSPDQYNLNIPFTPNGNTQTLGEDDISQMLFYNNEFRAPGYVYGLAYKYDNLLTADEVTHYPLKVWISQTMVTNLDGGWIPNEQSILVFDGVVEILPGNNRDLYIPFNQPVLINGIENVVIKNYQYDPEFPPSIFRMYGNNLGSGPTRSIYLLDVFDLDPENLPTYFGAIPSFSFTRFVVDPSTSSSVLSGIVYNNSNNIPVANATVSIPGSTLTAQTDVNGYYEFPALPYGVYNLKTSSTGFLDNTLDVDLNTTTQTQDIFLDPRAGLQVTGAVFGDNNGLPLEAVDVSIYKDGNLVETVTSDNNGDFILTNVFAEFDYEVKLFMYGYYEKMIPFSTVDTNIDLGNIILVQEFISPFDVYVNSDTAPTVHWKSPKMSSKVKLKKDLNVQSWSITNEPNENVWLGNFFSISKMTTLTSVEIQTGYYPNAVDYATIDIFDLASNTVLATSEPFLMHQDSLITIDIPNIVVSKTILAMVHWQNNVASTNSLALDYSDEFISNSAFIKFPDSAPQLLNNFLGAGSPRMSFLLRVNTLVDGSPVTNNETLSYNVFRGLATDFPNVSNWEKINLSPVSDVSLIDLNTSGINPAEYYRYAVETIYSNGYSEVTYSNSVAGNVLGISDYQMINSEIKVYPVPANDKITIKFGPNIQVNKPIKVYDILGKEVFTLESSRIKNGTVSKNINALQKGIYLIRIDVEGVIINKKFIVN